MLFQKKYCIDVKIWDISKFNKNDKEFSQFIQQVCFEKCGLNSKNSCHKESITKKEEKHLYNISNKKYSYTDHNKSTGHGLNISHKRRKLFKQNLNEIFRKLCFSGNKNSVSK
jgi:hypothetical protein